MSAARREVRGDDGAVRGVGEDERDGDLQSEEGGGSVSRLRFDGMHAGLGRVVDGKVIGASGALGDVRSGDRGDPANYTLICACGKELGPLARFRKDAGGFRTCVCGFCAQGTVEKDGQIVKVLSRAEVGFVMKAKRGAP